MSESVSSDPVGHSADLRTRIAAALRNMKGDLTYEAMADVVIRELNINTVVDGTEPFPFIAFLGVIPK